MQDYIFKNGCVVDGTGKASFIGDVAVKDGLITKIGTNLSDEAKEIIDITGLVIAPGFIDIHSHSDTAFLKDGRCQSKVYQGVTTELAGQCGSTIYPCPPENMGYMKTYAKNNDFDSDYYASTSFKEFMEKCEKTGKEMSTNLISLIGHGALRVGVMGQEPRKMNKDELKKMAELLDEDMKAGAWGVSLGLGYTPGINADQEELNTLGEVVSKYDGIITSHMRDQGTGSFKSLDEMYEINRATGSKVHIVHLKASGKAAWGTAEAIYKDIKAAQAAGVKVTIDMYPFNASSSGITNSLPKWSIEGGTQMAAQSLKEDNETGKRIMEYLEKNFAEKDDGERLLVVSTFGKCPDADGKNIWQTSQLWGISMADTIKKIIIDTNSHATCIAFAMDDDDVAFLLSREDIVIGSDGSGMPLNPAENNGSPHPRNFSTFPKFLRLMREGNVCSLETAVARMTGKSADILDLKDRGKLIEGMVADITVFDYENISDHNDFSNPFTKCTGIEHVMMAGEFALKNKEQTDKRLGTFILKK